MSTRHVRRAGTRRRALGLVAVGTAAGMLGITSAAQAQPPPQNGEIGPDQVGICHSEGKPGEPKGYVFIAPNKSSIINPVSGKLEGHGKDKDDVIPAFSIPRKSPPNPAGLIWTFPGSNMEIDGNKNYSGQKFIDNKCFPLAIEKTGTAEVLPGGTIKYKVAVTNLSPMTIPFDSVSVTDYKIKLIPPDVTTAMKPGETRTWTGEKKVYDSTRLCGMELTNTASVKLMKEPKRESSRRKRANGGTPMGQLSSWTTKVICPLDVAITKTPTQATVAPGGTVGYQVAVTNTGPLPVPTEFIEVKDEGATLTPPASPPEFLAPGASLLWGASRTAGSDASVCGTNVTNTASVTLNIPAPDGEQPKELVRRMPIYTFTPGADDTATAAGVPISGGICPVVTPSSTPAAPVAAFRPASPATLSVTKTGPARALRGGFVNFRVTVTNTGGATATGVTLSDSPARAMAWRAVPAGATVSGTTASWAIGDLAAGQSVSKVVRFRMRTSATGRSCNTALATATGLESARARACVTVVAAQRPATPVTG